MQEAFSEVLKGWHVQNGASKKFPDPKKSTVTKWTNKYFNVLMI